jgi:hypothetical protein
MIVYAVLATAKSTHGLHGDFTSLVDVFFNKEDAEIEAIKHRKPDANHFKYSAEVKEKEVK